ncbi:MAG: hypothetical protein ACHQIO_16475, partial [Nevskiales bacterium]
PMATAMTALENTGKHGMFVWAWGVNGCFSVIGAAAVPLLEVSYGIPAALGVGAAAYFVAILGAIGVMKPSGNAGAPALAG